MSPCTAHGPLYALHPCHVTNECRLEMTPLELPTVGWSLDAFGVKTSTHTLEVLILF